MLVNFFDNQVLCHEHIFLEKSYKKNGLGKAQMWKLKTRLYYIRTKTYNAKRRCYKEMQNRKLLKFGESKDSYEQITRKQKKNQD